METAQGHYDKNELSYLAAGVTLDEFLSSVFAGTCSRIWRRRRQAKALGHG